MTEKTKTVRLRATVVVEYDAHPEHYGVDDPADMALIDKDNWTDDPTMFFASFEDGQFKVTVEPVKS